MPGIFPDVDGNYVNPFNPQETLVCRPRQGITKPLFFAENGVDAWDDVTHSENQNDQAFFAKTSLSDALAHNILRGGPVDGYAFFTYSDDWFQHATGADYPWNSSVARHDTEECDWHGGPDNCDNQEWHGVMALALNDASHGSECYCPANTSIDCICPRLIAQKLPYWLDEPLRWNVTPEGIQSPETVQVTLSLKTLVPSSCKYDTTAGRSYDLMRYTFSTTGGTEHSHTVGIINGTTYRYYVRCMDNFGDINTTDYPVSFSVPFANKIYPGRITVNSGQFANMTFSVFVDPVNTFMYMYCPYGLTIGLNSYTNICNRWMAFNLPAGDTVMPFKVKNSTSKVLKAVPNFYVYKQARPNYAVGVSGEITANPSASRSPSTSPTPSPSSKPSPTPSPYTK